MAYRSTAFSLWGLVSFTRPAFERAAKSFQPLERMEGKRVVVTGASSGLGLAASLEFAKLGSDVVLVCRDKERGERALAQVAAAATGGAKIELQLLDLSELKSIKTFVDNFSRTQSGKIDVLCNNAGVLNNSVIRTSESLEQSYATNVLGTLHLTMLMLPHLKQGAKVVTVSSGGAYTALLSDLVAEQPKFDGVSAHAAHKRFQIESTGLFEQPKFDGVSAYAAHKRFQIESTGLFAKLFPSFNWYSCHPGWALTPGVQTALPNLTSLPLRTSEQGADVIVWLGSLSKTDKLNNGGFYFDRAEAVKHMRFAGTQPGTGETEKVLEKLVGQIEEIVGKDNVPYGAELRSKLNA